MKIHFNRSLVVLALLIVCAGTAYAVEEIQFPIPELGDCASRSACKTYCDKTENIQACATFAQERNLIPREVAERARKLVEILRSGGPGGCSTEKSCRTYCDNTSNLKECTQFAKQHGMLSGDESARLDKLVRLKELRANNPSPGSCTNITSCRKYCEQMEHASECLSFAEKTGLMQREQVEHARRLLPPIAVPRSRIKIVPGAADAKEEEGELQDVPENTMLQRPSQSPLPPELLRGAPTNAPAPQINLRRAEYRRAFIGTLLRALMQLF